MILTEDSICKIFDNTLLKPEATWSHISAFIDKSIKYGFRNVVVPWYAIPYAIKKVRGTEVGVGVGLGFPLGYSSVEMKLQELKYYISLGKEVTDFDIVINISAVKSKNWEYLKKEIRTLSQIVKKENRVCKFIIETSRLSEEEIVKVCEIIVDIPTVDFVKTGTGFGPRATTYRDVELINSVVEGKKEIKVSGGVRTLEQVERFISLGAKVFGSSSSVEIVEEFIRKRKNKGRGTNGN